MLGINPSAGDRYGFAGMQWDVAIDGGRGGNLFGLARGWLKAQRREE